MFYKVPILMEKVTLKGNVVVIKRLKMGLTFQIKIDHLKNSIIKIYFQEYTTIRVFMGYIMTHLVFDYFKSLLIP